MENREERTLESFERVLDYLRRHPVRPEPPLLTRMRTELEGSVSRLRELAVDQSTRLMIMPVRQLHARRQALRVERMMPLVRIAKPLLRFAPGSERYLRVPHARTDTLTLAKHAQQMARVLAPHWKLLADAGFTRTFVKDFRQEAVDLAKDADAWGKVRHTRSRATAGIKSEFRKAKKAVTVIEGILMNRDPDLRNNADWRSARRVHARIGRPKRRGKGATTLDVAPAS